MAEATNLNTNMLVVMGDFNYKEIDWANNKVAAGTNHPANKIYDVINDLFLTQLVLEPTRYRQGENSNVLDWVITDNPSKINNVQHGPPLGEKGDHCTICFDLTVTHNRSNNVGILLYNKADFSQIRQFLSSIDWPEMTNDLNTEQAWCFFSNKMSEVIRRFIPKSKPRLHKSPPWCNSTTKTIKKEKNKAWSTYKKDKSKENWESFTKTRNKCNRQIKSQIMSFEKQLASNIKTNPKIFWNYVKFTNGGQKDIPPIKDNGNTISDNREKAEHFNKYFAEVYTVEDMSNIPESPMVSTESQLSHCHITLDSISKELEKLNVSKAAGPDQIHPKLLSELRDVLAVPLFIIFDKSMKEGKLPPQWKEAYIKPIHKKGSKHKASNYRPVSLTSVCCKIMERIIRKDLMKHLEGNNLISDNQHGFRSGRSCCTQLLELMEIWSNMLDKKEAWDCIYLDFAKAFDKVPHFRLGLKLEANGITGKLLEWLKDFLNNRQQKVVIKDTKSNPREVTSGIPQGSVLGPVLFIVYINDLPQVVNSYVKIFADDTKLFRAVTDTSNRDNLQEDLDALHNWSVKWQLKFNEDKCKIIHYGGNNPRLTYKLNNTELEACSTEKDLGITFDEKLKFSQHIGNITAKANSRLAIIKRSMHDLTPEIFLPLYKSLVRPLLEYCSPVWNPVLKKDSLEIEKVQRRATKLVTSISDKEYSERMYILKLDSLNFRRRRMDLIQVFRIIKGIDNIPPNLFFKFQESTRTRGHNLKLFKISPNCTIRANSFSIRVINDWNSLPQSIVSSKTINAFKSGLKKFWASHPERYDMP